MKDGNFSVSFNFGFSLGSLSFSYGNGFFKVVS